MLTVDDSLPCIAVKKLTPDAQIPVMGDQYAAGLDLISCKHVTLPVGKVVVVPTGIAMEIPVGMVGLIWPRSKLAVQHGIDVMAGVVDSNYRGEIMVALLNTGSENVMLPAGSKVAQMVIQQQFSWFPLEVVNELQSTDRGDKGINCSDLRLS